MNYAVLSARSKQYLVKEGDSLYVQGSEFSDNEIKVLLLSLDGKLNIGTPELGGTGLKLKVISDVVKGQKISVLKYKAKSRYRKKLGYRPKFTQVVVEKLPSK